jgi:peptide/nickel transport system permease protein
MGKTLAGQQGKGEVRYHARLWLARVAQLPKISTAFLLIVVVCAIFASQVSPGHPTKVNFDYSYTPPIWQEGGSFHRFLGADELGRDLLTRIIHGARISLIVGLGAVLVTAVVGTVVGIASGYFGGRIDSALSALIDVWLSIPPILFLLLLALVIGRSLPGLIIALTVLSWPRYARIVRGQVLTLKERDFVALAKVSGSSPQRIMAVHILPNVVNSVLVLGTLDVGRFIVLESSLSFLGLGVQPPAPAWGVMISDARNQLQIAWWTAIMPGLALVATVLSANSFGDWLRDKLDPIRRAN